MTADQAQDTSQTPKRLKCAWQNATGYAKFPLDADMAKMTDHRSLPQRRDPLTKHNWGGKWISIDLSLHQLGKKRK